MRPAEYTTEEIIAAGEAIQGAGRNVTGFALRQKVGGGNPSRLRQVWDEHLASKQAAEVEPVAELPVEVAETVAAVTKALTERIAALAVELNDKAVKAAERRVGEVVRAAGEQRAQAERELADAAQTVDDLEQVLADMKAKREKLDRHFAENLIESQKQAVEIAQLKERLAAVEHSHQEHRKEVAKEAQRCADKVLAAEKARDEYEKEARAAREKAAHCAGQLEALQAQNAKLLEALGKDKGGA